MVLSWVAPCGQCRYCTAGREARCQVAATIVAPGGTLEDGTSPLSRSGEKLSRRPLQTAEAGLALRTLLVP